MNSNTSRFVRVCHAIIAIALASLLLATRARAADTDHFKFAFGPGSDQPGVARISPSLVYAKDRGYGFVDTTGIVAPPGGGCTSDMPFQFAVDLPDGNYDVTVTVGPSTGSGEAHTTVRAQWRRLMIEDISTNPNRAAIRKFTVNVRGGQLQIEFTGHDPRVNALDIEPNTHAVTVYIAGDSTVCDQRYEPFAGWGQLLPRFFKPGVVAVANHAQSGRAANSFVHEKRLDAILKTIKPGDYLLVQFAHNDMKQPAMQPFTTYKAALKVYLDEARKRGAIPVLVTPPHRRFFNPDGTVQNTLKEFPDAMRLLAREEHVTLIDLNAMSKVFYEALGPDKSKLAFSQYPAHTFPAQEKELKDNTHFNEYGAYELARCVAEGIRKSDLDLAKDVVDDLPEMNTTSPALKPAGPTTRQSGGGAFKTPEGS